MRIISAADSVSLAIQRTKEFLFKPFSWGTYLKLGLVAIITEGLGHNFQSSSHKSQPSVHGPFEYSPFHLSPLMIAEIVFAVMLAIVVAVWLCYLVTRLRFAFFNCLVHNTKEIRPGWRLYQAEATRFFWFNVVVGICYLVVVVLIALPFAVGFFKLFHGIPPGGHPDWVALIALALPLIPIIILLVLAGILIDVTLRDCMLPHFALGNASAGEAWVEVWARIKAEKRQFFVYALLRLILPTIALVALFLVLLIPGLILGGSLAAVEYSLHSVFADATGASAVVGVLLKVFFGLVAFGFGLLFSICLGGPISTGIREYALIFYGGRYQPLGDLLYPPDVSQGTPGIA
jgi:hypothetical protein